MSKIKRFESVVLKVLEEQPHTRLDDMFLTARVYDELLKNRAIGIYIYTLTFDYVCYHRAELGLPTFETVRRTRQKIQSKRPDLVDESTLTKRRKFVEEYKEYAKEV